MLLCVANCTMDFDFDNQLWYSSQKKGLTQSFEQNNLNSWPAQIYFWAFFHLSNSFFFSFFFQWPLVWNSIWFDHFQAQQYQKKPKSFLKYLEVTSLWNVGLRTKICKFEESKNLCCMPYSWEDTRPTHCASQCLLISYLEL